MRSYLIRLLLVCLVLVMVTGDSFAGPFLNRIRERRSGGCGSSGCTTTSAARPYAHAIQASGGCAGGVCPIK